MGFSTLLDIMASSIVGGMLLLILFRMNDASIQNTFKNSGELIVQQDLVEVVKLLEYDFRKVGYCLQYNKIPDPSKSIIYADSSRISFITDVAVPPTYPKGEGNIDTLTYYLGPASELTSTPNPNDRLLYRVLNHQTPRGSNLGVTLFHLTYFNAMGSLLPCPVVDKGQISTIQIDIEIQDLAAYNDQYSSVFWRQIRMIAPNLKNR